MFHLAGLQIVLALSATEGHQDRPTLQDWAYVTEPSQALTAASISSPTGLTLSARCQSGEFVLQISGLPGVATEFARVERRYEDGRLEQTYWRHTGAERGEIILESPRMARSFRPGGRLTLNVALQDKEPAQLSFELPDRSENIDRVLTDCGLPLSDPFDGALNAGDLLEAVPRVSPPAWLWSRQGSIRISVECLIVAGRLSACRSPQQQPSDPRAGAAAARAANGVRVRLRDPAAAEGRYVEMVLMMGG